MSGNNRKIQNTYIPTRPKGRIVNHVTHNNEGCESDEDNNYQRRCEYPQNPISHPRHNNIINIKQSQRC